MDQQLDGGLPGQVVHRVKVGQVCRDESGPTAQGVRSRFALGGITAAESFRINTGFRELDPVKGKAETALKPGYSPGDLGFDPFNLKPTDQEELRIMQEKELAHGRLAMIAAAGFLAQEAVTP